MKSRFALSCLTLMLFSIAGSCSSESEVAPATDSTEVERTATPDPAERAAPRQVEAPVARQPEVRSQVKPTTQPSPSAPDLGSSADGASVGAADGASVGVGDTAQSVNRAAEAARENLPSAWQALGRAVGQGVREAAQQNAQP